MATQRTLGVIGGSGLYGLDGLEDVERRKIDTPFGAPSDELLIGRLGDARLVFLPRHGRGHRILPNEVNSRANILAMKQLGVEWIISISAVGSMKEEIRPGDLVIVDQFIDRTRARPSSLFGDGAVGHIAFADPICPSLHDWLVQAARGAAAAAGSGAKVHERGTYIVIDGPQFSTRAESLLYRSWGVDVIGMTALPEAKLAREAEICYATVALATDYDCWHVSEEAVTVDAVLAVLRRNVDTARDIVRRAVDLVRPPRDGLCPNAARGALMTDPAQVTPEARKRLAGIIGKYL